MARPKIVLGGQRKFEKKNFSESLLWGFRAGLSKGGFISLIEAANKIQSSYTSSNHQALVEAKQEMQKKK